MSTATAAALEHARETFEETLLECAYCPPDDNRWPASEFSWAGTAFRRKKRMCNACYAERYPARYLHCAGCNREMRTRRTSGQPLCRRCRRGEPPAVCIDCGTSTTASGRQFHDRPVGPLCSACYLARRDARRRAAA